MLDRALMEKWRDEKKEKKKQAELDRDRFELEKKRQADATAIRYKELELEEKKLETERLRMELALAEKKAETERLRMEMELYFARQNAPRSTDWLIDRFEKPVSVCSIECFIVGLSNRLIDWLVQISSLATFQSLIVRKKV